MAISAGRAARGALGADPHVPISGWGDRRIQRLAGRDAGGGAGRRRLIALLIALPTAAKLARLDPTGDGAGYFDELRARQRIVASIAGTARPGGAVGGAMVR